MYQRHIVVVVGLVCTLSSCGERLHELGDAPFKGEIAGQVYSEYGEHQIIQKVNIFQNLNFYYSVSSSRETLHFLLNVSFDSNEEVAKAEWSAAGQHFVFFVVGSSRFISTTRVALYSFSSDGVREVADVKDLQVSDVYFSAESLVIVEDSGAVQEITL